MFFAGDEPLVIARGGFSGIFPDSSYFAYSLAVQTGLPNVHLWCDVQLTKDGAGICFPDIKLENSSDIDVVFKSRDKTYVVNGASVKGWFSVDFTLKELGLVNCKLICYSMICLLESPMTGSFLNFFSLYIDLLVESPK